jgi:hypothetical protein
LFINHQLTRDEFSAMKEQGLLPYGQIPALSVRALWQTVYGLFEALLSHTNI